MALPVPTKVFLQANPDTAMLFAPFGCTHPPPPVPSFLLMQNLSPKDIAGSDIMKQKVSGLHMKSLGRKGLTTVHVNTVHIQLRYSRRHSPQGILCKLLVTVHISACFHVSVQEQLRSLVLAPSERVIDSEELFVLSAFIMSGTHN